MSSVSLNLSIHDTLQSVEKVKRQQHGLLAAILSLPVSYLVKLHTKNIKKMSVNLAEQCLSLTLYRREVDQWAEEAQPGDALIDPDFKMWDSLALSMTSLKEIRAGLGSMIPATRVFTISPKIHQGLLDAECIFLKVISEAYEATLELQRAVTEHDASLSVHHDGFQASSADEVEAMLARIAA